MRKITDCMNPHTYIHLPKTVFGAPNPWEVRRDKNSAPQKGEGKLNSRILDQLEGWRKSSHGIFMYVYIYIYIGVEPKIGVVVTPPPNHPLKNRVWNQYFHHPFWGTLVFGNTHIYIYINPTYVLKILVWKMYLLSNLAKFPGSIYYWNMSLLISR